MGGDWDGDEQLCSRRGGSFVLGRGGFEHIGVVVVHFFAKIAQLML